MMLNLFKAFLKVTLVPEVFTDFPTQINLPINARYGNTLSALLMLLHFAHII